MNTPHQNGLAERRMGYILATARSLLFQANMSKKYWGEAVLTAAHLINRIPMKVIGYDSPLSRLKKSFPIIRLFSGLPPRVFGCVAFIHQDAGKLDPRGLKCVFIGYSGTQKGYRCYHPPSRKFFVSADVVFNEDDLYFVVAKRVLSSSPVEKEQIDLEFLRYLGTIQLDAPTSTVESVTDGKDIVQTPADSDGEGQTNPRMATEEGDVEMDNSQHYTEIKEDSTSESQVEQEMEIWDGR